MLGLVAGLVLFYVVCALCVFVIVVITDCWLVGGRLVVGWVRCLCWLVVLFGGFTFWFVVFLLFVVVWVLVFVLVVIGVCVLCLGVCLSGLVGCGWGVWLVVVCFLGWVSWVGVFWVWLWIVNALIDGRVYTYYNCLIGLGGLVVVVVSLLCFAGLFWVG